MNLARTAAVSAVAVLGLAGAACSSGSGDKAVTTQTVTASTTVTPTATTSASTKASPTTTASPKPTSTTTLGGDCNSILPLTEVDKAVGTPVPGKTAFIVNLPDATIGQVERVNCRYGLAAAAPGKKAPNALVEVSVSLYESRSAAAKRISATEEEWRQNSASPHTVQVAGHPATVLTGYGDPLLVVAAGPRTVAASIDPSVAKPAARDRVLVALAAAALRGAGG